MNNYSEAGMNKDREVQDSTVGDAEFSILKKRVEALDTSQLETLKRTIETKLNIKRGALLSDVEREAILAIFQ